MVAQPPFIEELCRFSSPTFSRGASPALPGNLDDHLATTEVYLNLSPEHEFQELNARW